MSSGKLLNFALYTFTSFVYFIEAVRTKSTIYFAGPRYSRENPTVYPNIAGTSFLYYQHQNGVTYSKNLLVKDQ